MRFIQNFIQEETGADMLEYALTLILIALACIAGLKSLESQTGSALNSAGAAISSSL
jgi:Flp pilus assembly pilin Flp